MVKGPLPVGPGVTLAVVAFPKRDGVEELIESVRLPEGS